MNSLSTAILWFSQILSYLVAKMVHFLVRISKNVSSEKPKQNLKRERVGGGEGKFTIPTLCPSDQERETGDKGNRSKE